MTMQQERAAALVVTAIIETIEEMGEDGAPLGIMYAVLMGKIGYETFMKVIHSLEQANVIKVRSHVAYIVKQKGLHS